MNDVVAYKAALDQDANIAAFDADAYNELVDVVDVKDLDAYNALFATKEYNELIDPLAQEDVPNKEAVTEVAIKSPLPLMTTLPVPAADSFRFKLSVPEPEVWIAIVAPILPEFISTINLS